MANPDVERSISVPWGYLLVFLAGLWPFSGFAGHNVSESLDYLRLGISFAGFLALALAVYWVTLRLVRRDRHGGVSAALAAGILVFFSYHWFDGTVKAFGFAQARYALSAWGIALGLAAAAGWIAGQRRNALPVLAAVVGGMAAIPLASVIWTALMTAPAPEAATGKTPGTHAGTRKPLQSVYFIVPDAYSRADRLMAMFGHDNSGFLKQLADRGFTVADGALANFPVSTVSISSMLDMRYPEEVKKGTPATNQIYSTRIAGYNRAVREFKSMGYRYVHAAGGDWGGSLCRGAEDLCLRGERHAKGFAISQQEAALVAMTPLEIVLRAAGIELLLQQNHTQSRFRANLNRIGKGPNFVFYHLMDAHGAPFDTECRYIRESSRLKAAASGSMRDVHAHTIKCTNRHLIKTIDAILSREPDAIVILQSDHGLGGPDWHRRVFKNFSREDFLNRYGILSAVRVPEGCRSYFAPDRTAINTLPAVLGCLKGTKPGFLPDRVYLMNYKDERVEIWREK